MHQNELAHHGIPGMRWGVRRYQNKDGSLTPAGRKRAASDKVKNINEATKNRLKKIKAEEKSKIKIAEAKAKSSEKIEKAKSALNSKIEKAKQKYGKKDDEKNDQETKPKAKSIKDMSDEELARMTNRMNLEANYIRANNTLKDLNPKKVSLGEKLVSEAKDKLVKSAADTLIKAVTKKIEKKLGLDVEDTYTKLKKEADILNQKKLIKEYKEALTDSKTKQLKRENEEYQARETNENYRKKFSDTGIRERQMREAADNMQALSKYMNNAKAAYQANKFFEDERHKWAEQQAEEYIRRYANNGMLLLEDKQRS